MQLLSIRCRNGCIAVQYYFLRAVAAGAAKAYRSSKAKTGDY